MEFDQYKTKIKELEEENQRLNRTNEGLKRAVGKWKLRFSGEKGVNQKVDNRSTDVNHIQIIINNVREFKVKIVVDSEIPNNLSIKEVKELIENMNPYDVFPELGKKNKYKIKEAFCGKQKNVWSIVLVG
jgi:predicted RNase H-like nuclease (RuvC/YqgF family)